MKKLALILSAAGLLVSLSACVDELDEDVVVPLPSISVQPSISVSPSPVISVSPSKYPSPVPDPRASGDPRLDRNTAFRRSAHQSGTQPYVDRLVPFKLGR